ncbi:MAG: GTP-binding protein TypA [Candidatus Tagabacteria bacterium RIFCSPLOWO2_01_FULL_39_11]|uniref:50S ribosomal subunit assembly factor BipA n=1 Tax=Candidatus Tagabacteria bacterium RIFCSPLOWO2_01_FULL_39_11 TaxID=1802295 RepID=A0A1G2LPE3_9BACT|nr:MAG: GTP-binding protein TypA [Candidatus Tagabacteria bacterium RIFCSPLOWO2_01_FULL_39_11]
MEIRNIAIIAHVDHGKTTLTNAIMRQTGMFEESMSMDTNALEVERGITIYAKNTATFYPSMNSGQAPLINSSTPSSGPRSPGRAPTKINIVDTPGHADFGSEVERVLRSIDSVLLVVDAQEGPMPQTRFVLKKSLELGLKPILVINKIDKKAADPKRTEEEVLELFMELGATDEQMDFTVIYSIAKEGIAIKSLDDERKDITPLLDAILSNVAPAASDTFLPFKAQPFSLGYDNYLGRLAIARVYEGAISAGEKVYILTPDGESRSGAIVKLFTFKGMSRVETQEAQAGDIVIISGLQNIFIGETICGKEGLKPLPAIKVDEPTITLNFLINNSPFAGREGKYLTSRQLRERLKKELEVNVGLKVDFSQTDFFKVSGRGELHIAILLENMRREGYEMQVSQPQVIFKETDTGRLEPFEEIVVNVPSEFQGTVIEKLGARKAILKEIKKDGETARLIFEGPTRGLLGYRGQFIIDTRGDGILTSRVIGFKPYAGEIAKKITGSMTSISSGKALAFSLNNLQKRGVLFIGPSTEVYEGMVIGNISKGTELAVNPIKGKELTNMRASGSDEAIYLTPALELTIEGGLEIISGDEYLEITPKSVRLRKQHLTKIGREKNKRLEIK